MRALTLWRPWAWAIVHGPKRIENRPWAPWPSIIGQRIAIHAGKQFDGLGSSTIMANMGITALPPAAEHQGFVGTAVVLGHVTESSDPWFFGPFGWLLGGVRALPEPIPCKGALGLWRVPDDVAVDP